MIQTVKLNNVAGADRLEQEGLVLVLLSGLPGHAGYGHISRSRPFLPGINWLWQIVLL